MPGLDVMAQAPVPPIPSLTPVAPTPPAPAPAPAPAAAAPPSAPTTPQGADSAVGSVATLQGSASVTRHNAQSALKLRDPIYRGDVLQTGVSSTLGITFDDDTTFTLSANSRFAVDEFVYADGGTHNVALFTIFLGKVAFIADKVAHTGNMKIVTPTATLGIRGTTGLIEVPPGATPGTTGEVAIKLYPDANGRVGRIEVFGRDGAQLGVLSRGATGFSIRPGAIAGRFAAVPLQISAQEAARDRLFVRQAASTQLVGHQNNLQRRNFQQRFLQPRPNLERLPGQRRLERTPRLQPRLGQPTLPRGFKTSPNVVRPGLRKITPPKINNNLNLR